MTKREAVVISAYTGFLIGDFSDVHEYIKSILGRPVYTHELVNKFVLNEIREKSKPDFIAICRQVAEEENQP